MQCKTTASVDNARTATLASGAVMLAVTTLYHIIISDNMAV